MTVLLNQNPRAQCNIKTHRDEDLPVVHVSHHLHLQLRRQLLRLHGVHSRPPCRLTTEHTAADPLQLNYSELGPLLSPSNPKTRVMSRLSDFRYK